MGLKINSNRRRKQVFFVLLESLKSLFEGIFSAFDQDFGPYGAWHQTPVHQGKEAAVLRQGAESMVDSI